MVCDSDDGVAVRSTRPGFYATSDAPPAWFVSFLGDSIVPSSRLHILHDHFITDYFPPEANGLMCYSSHRSRQPSGHILQKFLFCFVCLFPSQFYRRE